MKQQQQRIEEYKALIRSGRATCPSTSGTDLELWEEALNEVSHPERPFDILLDGKPEMILWARTEAHARSLAMIEFEKRGETAKHFNKTLRAVARGI